jgi:hypothetical protein
MNKIADMKSRLGTERWNARCMSHLGTKLGSMASLRANRTYGQTSPDTISNYVAIRSEGMVDALISTIIFSSVFPTVSSRPPKRCKAEVSPVIKTRAVT